VTLAVLPLLASRRYRATALLKAGRKA